MMALFVVGRQIAKFGTEVVIYETASRLSVSISNNHKTKKHSPKNFSKYVTVTTHQLTNRQTDTTAGCTLVITGTHQVVLCQAK
jgi:hypothetical protein